jgi:hypothetical protein
MTLRIAGSVAAVLAAAAVAGPAWAIPTPEGSWIPPADDAPVPIADGTPSPDETFDYAYEADESDPGIECIPTEWSRADAETETTTSAYAWDEGDACASGEFRPSCKRVVVKVKQRSLLFLSVAFEWVVEKTWCWSYPRITSWSIVTYPTTMDRFMKYRGLVSRWDRYFQACCFSSTSGHTSYRMAEFENCIPLKGCLGSWYPRVKIHVAAGGAWRYEKDV